MATGKIEAALGELGDISTFVGTTPLRVVMATSTTLSLIDSDGDGFTFTGTGLTYGLSGVTGGAFTGLRIFAAGGVTLETVADFSAAAQPFFMIYQLGGIAAGVLELFKGDDALTGSGIGDKLFGFGGNDTIKGGGGGDIIAGSVGRDKEFGQGGADVFLFVKGDGKDMVMDFTDLGGNSDDRISVTQRMYNAMTVEETLTGVTLHFGIRDSIEVKNWHAADVGHGDFLIV